MTWVKRFWKDNPRMIVQLEGCEIQYCTGEIEKGDTYIAERNRGVVLLTCRENDKAEGIIFPVEMAYPYDTHECRKVVSIDGELI